MPPHRSLNIQSTIKKTKPYKAPVVRPRRRTIPRSERLAKKAVRDAKQQTIHEKICQLWQIIIDFAEQEAPKINTTVDELISGVLSLGRQKTRSRKPNPWNAHQHLEAKKRKEASIAKQAEHEENLSDPELSVPAENENPPEDHENTQQDTYDDENVHEPTVETHGEDPEDDETDHDENLKPTLREAVQASKRSYKESDYRTPEELEVLKQKLEAHRAERSAVVKKQFTAHQADVRKTLDQISRLVKDLGHRCEIEMIAIAVRTKLEHKVKPQIIATEEAKKFFQKMFRQEPLKFAFQMENYFTNGLFGTLARNANERQTNLKGEIRRLLTEGLVAITNNERIQFPWTDFFPKITEGYLVEIRNWPLNYFVNPSNFKTRADLETVRDALITGSCHFARIDQARLTELKIKRANAKKDGRNCEVSIFQESDKAGPAIQEVAAMPTGSGSTTHAGNVMTEQELGSQLPLEPLVAIDTYQNTFQANSNVSHYTTVPLELYPPSTHETFAHPTDFIAPLSTYDLGPTTSHPDAGTLQVQSQASEPRASESSGQPAKKRQRWDAGLDRDSARKTKDLAEAAGVTPAEYLASHPEMFERSKKKRDTTQKQGGAARAV